jgi:parallel beta-helix repeat protein
MRIGVWVTRVLVVAFLGGGCLHKTGTHGAHDAGNDSSVGGGNSDGMMIHTPTDGMLAMNGGDAAVTGCGVCNAPSVCISGQCYACTGAALTTQSQVQANTSYCGGTAHEQIKLAAGDTWTSGEVTGVAAAEEHGAVECDGDNCAIINANVHDNPGWAGIYLFGNHLSVIGGRVTNSNNLGIGSDLDNYVTVDGVEIDHNNVTDVNCGFEGGGIKFVSSNTTIKNNYVHDNGCMGIWFDVAARTNEISFNRVFGNHQEGIFYEISFDATIHDNDCENNGVVSMPGWMWGGGITIASSTNVEIYNNTVKNNYNGISGTQQDRSADYMAPHLLNMIHVHDNVVSGSGSSGWAEDDGSNLSTRDLTFVNNTLQSGQVYCGTGC